MKKLLTIAAFSALAITGMRGDGDGSKMTVYYHYAFDGSYAVDSVDLSSRPEKMLIRGGLIILGSDTLENKNMADFLVNYCFDSSVSEYNNGVRHGMASQMAYAAKVFGDTVSANEIIGEIPEGYSPVRFVHSRGLNNK